MGVCWLVYCQNLYCKVRDGNKEKRKTVCNQMKHMTLNGGEKASITLQVILLTRKANP